MKTGKQKFKRAGALFFKLLGNAPSRRGGVLSLARKSEMPLGAKKSQESRKNLFHCLLFQGFFQEWTISPLLFLTKKGKMAGLFIFNAMPRGKKKQASVGFCTECGQIVQHFYLNNKKENKETKFEKYCNVCRKKQPLRVKDEKGKSNK